MRPPGLERDLDSLELESLEPLELDPEPDLDDPSSPLRPIDFPPDRDLDPDRDPFDRLLDLVPPGVPLRRTGGFRRRGGVAPGRRCGGCGGEGWTVRKDASHGISSLFADLFPFGTSLFGRFRKKLFSNFFS